MKRAGERLGEAYKLHVVEGGEAHVPEAFFSETVSVTRAEGSVQEKRAERLAEDMLSHEWEWEGTPEVTLRIVDDVDEAIDLFNRYSPQFIASLVTRDADERERFDRLVNAALDRKSTRLNSSH